MNYYEHHLGDYAEATAHLSFVEDAAYSRCIRKYYTTEGPLPADMAAVQRLVGARSKEERQAVETVLEEFFALMADGWHNNRCDEELARYKDKQSKAKRSAQARWNAKPPHSDGTADAMRTHTEGNALQSPVPNPQAPVKKSSLRSDSARAREPTAEPPEGLNSEAWDRWSDYRSKIRKPLKPVSIPAAQRELAAFGGDQAAVVEQSIANGYQGLFALKARSMNGATKPAQPQRTWRPPPDEDAEHA